MSTATILPFRRRSAMPTIDAVMHHLGDRNGDHTAVAALMGLRHADPAVQAAAVWTLESSIADRIGTGRWDPRHASAQALVRPIVDAYLARRGY